MKVELGFSGEFAKSQWRNGKIETDETDLLRILNEQDIEMLPEQVPSKLAFVIMEAETTQLIYTEILGYGGDEKECNGKIKNAVERQQEAFSRLRKMAK